MAQFSDLNDHCLENICQYLNFIDLLNVADANKKFRGVAETVFSLNHSEELINLNSFLQFDPSYALKSNQSDTFQSENQSDVCALKTTLQFIRCFGHLFTKLEVQYTKIHSKRGMINRYISQFCSDSLTEMKFSNIKASDFSDIDRPFTKVENVEFVDCCVGESLSQFHQWFPKMSHLILFRSELAKPANILEHFPNLIDLSLHGFSVHHIPHVTTALRLNPQLRKLELGSFFRDARFLQYIGKHLRNLETLKITWDLNRVRNFKNAEIRFENVSEFELCFLGKRPLPKIPFSFGRIEEFTLETGCKLNQNLTDFLSIHSSLTMLLLIGLGDTEIDGEIKIEISETLPSLKIKHCSPFSIQYETY